MKKVSVNSAKIISFPLILFLAFVSFTQICHAQSLEDQFNNQSNQQNQKRNRAMTMWGNAQFTATSSGRECESRREDYNATRYLLDSKQDVYQITKDMWSVYYVGSLIKSTYIIPGGYQDPYVKNETLSNLKLVNDNGRQILIQFQKDPYNGRVSRSPIACRDF
jgi:hypothetical protein